ncbi:MAG: hypothetical protein LBV74_09305 [Tannerella sp.]|jgi:hypothetical protein|nr:hypothetical protein [Tannerella sp.]
MKKAVLILISILAYVSLNAQDASFIPTKEGAVCTYKYLDAKGKPQTVKKTKEETFLRYTVSKITEEADGMHIEILNETNLFDELEQNEVNTKLMEDIKKMNFRIENNTLYADNMLAKTSALMSSQFEKMASGDMKMDMTTEGQQVRIPLDLSVGQTLPEEEVMKITMKMTGIMNMTFYTTTTYKNRKVEAKEDITTPAGTFNCYKVCYDLEVGMDMGMMKQGATQKIVEWLSPEIGTVKQETYNQKGKLESTMLLSETKNI